MTKIFPIFFSSILLASCAANGGSYQSINFKDGRDLDCRLLSVRTDTLLVDTSRPPARELRDVKAAAFPISSIEVFHYDPTSAGKTIFLSAGIGLAAGATVGSIDAANDHDTTFIVVPSTTPKILGGAVYGAIIGVLTGAVIKAFNTHNYDPHDPNDLEKISRIAIYPAGEPAELEKIK